MKKCIIVGFTCGLLFGCGGGSPQDGVGGGDGMSTGGGTAGGGEGATGGGEGATGGGEGATGGGEGATGGGEGATGGGGGTTGGGGGTTGGGGGMMAPTHVQYWDGGASIDAGDLDGFEVPFISTTFEYGQRYAGTCAPGFMASEVWGTDLYTSDSHYCTAGVHLGLIDFATGGELTVEVRPGALVYASTTRFGVTTSAYGSWRLSVAFVGTDAGLLGDIAAAEQAGSVDAGGDDAGTYDAGTYDAGPFVWDGGSLWDGGVVQSGGMASVTSSPFTYAWRGRNGERFLITCGPVSSAPRIWGTGVYTDDSPLCTAAVHAGAISMDGGVFTVELLPGLTQYVGSSANGITSSNWVSFPGSYRVEP